MPASGQEEVTFEQFCEEWLREFTESDLSPFDKGQQFAFKLVSQWLNVSEGDEDLILCDGTGDGGIDIAYLDRSDLDEDGQDGQFAEGDTWYLVQSKYGTAFQGRETIFNEGRKVIETLTGGNKRLSEETSRLVERLNVFVEKASEKDHLILVFATDQPMSETDRRALDDIRTLGREKFPQLFDVEDISLQTIWEAERPPDPEVSVRIQGEFVEPSDGLRVGTIFLTNLYEFLKDYRDKTGSLDQLYEKNVRQFLGRRKKINKGIFQTLDKEPQMFGLYNNGITIVVSDFSANKENSLTLHNPYVVNGCQTTRTIWDVLQRKLDSGGTGESAAASQWRILAERGVVVTKIVKSDKVQISNITRYTNSQNAVLERDFVALRSDFNTWAEETATRFGVFLEIQRGGWDARKAWEKSHPSSRKFSDYANAFELIKIYGAGWMREPGTAFGKNEHFLPGGRVFKQITTGINRIGVDDLYVTHQIHKLAAQYKFGRNAKRDSRRQTRFFYYFVLLELLRDTLHRASFDYEPSDLTRGLQILLREENQDNIQALSDAAIAVIDDYLSQENGNSVFEEPDYSGNLNTFLKAERLGRDPNFTPELNILLMAHKASFRVSVSGLPSRHASVTEAIRSG